MASRAEATLWMLIKQGDQSRYVSVSEVVSGRYAPNMDDWFIDVSKARKATAEPPYRNLFPVGE
jgi:hypothetical protein